MNHVMLTLVYLGVWCSNWPSMVMLAGIEFIDWWLSCGAWCAIWVSMMPASQTCMPASFQVSNQLEESHACATDSPDWRASRPWRPSAHADLLFGRMHNRDAAIFGRIGTWTSHTCLADSGDAACLKMKMYLYKSHLNNKDAFDYRINHLGLNVCSPCWPMNFHCLRYTRLQPSHYSLEMTRKFKLFVTVCCVCFTMSESLIGGIWPKIAEHSEWYGGRVNVILHSGKPEIHCFQWLSK